MLAADWSVTQTHCHRWVRQKLLKVLQWGVLLGMKPKLRLRFGTVPSIYDLSLRTQYINKLVQSPPRHSLPSHCQFRAFKSHLNSLKHGTLKNDTTVYWKIKLSTIITVIINLNYYNRSCYCNKWRRFPTLPRQSAGMQQLQKRVGCWDNFHLSTFQPAAARSKWPLPLSPKNNYYHQNRAGPDPLT